MCIQNIWKTRTSSLFWSPWSHDLLKSLIGRRGHNVSDDGARDPGDNIDSQWHLPRDKLPAGLGPVQDSRARAPARHHLTSALTARAAEWRGDAAVHSGAPRQAGGGLEARGGGDHRRGHDGQPRPQVQPRERIQPPGGEPPGPGRGGLHLLRVHTQRPRHRHPQPRDTRWELGMYTRHCFLCYFFDWPFIANCDLCFTPDDRWARLTLLSPPRGNLHVNIPEGPLLQAPVPWQICFIACPDIKDV